MSYEQGWILIAEVAALILMFIAESAGKWGNR